VSYLTPHVAIINESTVVSDADIDARLPHFRQAVQYHFRPFWGTGCSIARYPKGTTLPADRLVWPALIADNSDQAGALGYHETDAAGTRPDLKVFAKTDQQYHLSWEVTLMHEIFEELADPYIAAMTQVSDAAAYATEVGDPVEADRDGYDITLNGLTVRISNFIYPSWLIPGSPGPYDHGHLLTKPLEVRQGGYVSICKPVSGKFQWSQFQQQKGQLVPVGHESDWEDRRDVFVAEDGSVRVDHPRFRDRNNPRRAQ
jgi:hypothetical protein